MVLLTDKTLFIRFCHFALRLWRALEIAFLLINFETHLYCFDASFISYLAIRVPKIEARDLRQLLVGSKRVQLGIISEK